MLSVQTLALSPSGESIIKGGGGKLNGERFWLDRDDLHYLEGPKNVLEASAKAL